VGTSLCAAEQRPPLANSVLTLQGFALIRSRWMLVVALLAPAFRRLFADPHFAPAAWNNAVYAFGTILPSRRAAAPLCRRNRAEAAGLSLIFIGNAEGFNP